MRALPLLSLFALLTGCPTGSPLGGETGDTASDTGGVAPGGINHGGLGGSDGDRLIELTDPCQGQGTPNAMLFTTDDAGWLGCGNGMGLWRTTDGGGSWTAGHPSADLYIFGLAQTPSGDVLACGHDYEAAADDALLYRYDGSDWTTLLHYGNNEKDPSAAYLSNCGQVAAAGDGTIIVASNTSPDLTWSADDGQTWAAADRYWEDANLEEGGYAVYTMLDLVAVDGQYFGAGSTITEPPTFLAPSESGDWANFHAVTVTDSVIGEVWALATPDQGSTWFAGGRDEGATRRASGFLYRSDDRGQSWTAMALPEGADTVRGIAFAEDGQHGVAVGVRYPTSDGGYVLLTDDGGQRWTLLDEAVPMLESAEAGRDLYWIAGDAFVARGSF